MMEATQMRAWSSYFRGPGRICSRAGHLEHCASRVSPAYVAERSERTFQHARAQLAARLGPVCCPAHCRARRVRLRNESRTRLAAPLGSVRHSAHCRARPRARQRLVEQAHRLSVCDGSLGLRNVRRQPPGDSIVSLLDRPNSRKEKLASSGRRGSTPPRSPGTCRAPLLK